MRIARFEYQGQTGWGVVDAQARTIGTLPGTPADWGPGLAARPGVAPETTGTVRIESVRLLAPVEPGAKVLAAGATYAKHVAGIGLKMPEQPAAFLKPYESLIGPFDDIVYPALTNELDYEVELVVIIGAPVRAGDSAEQGILGYCVGNDVSARDLQFGGSVTGMDMFSAKGLDDTSGLGPWIVTKDEFGDGHPDLELTLRVDGEVRQQARTSEMVWGAAELVDYVARRSRLAPGDVLFTGTPQGVGHEDGRMLTRGAVVEATIERIGTIRNTVR
jgi:2-keto-4-pentenoate hydratase/2-oxohepta-3-ene-1,7-dioic acid hydratase in catechol pathway